MSDTVRLRIEHDADGVSVESINPIGDGAPRADAPGETGGLGLVGMRERVAAAGGSLHVGPQADDTFMIRAHIPNAEHPR